MKLWVEEVGFGGGLVVVEMEVEKAAEEYSKEELRRQLYASLRSTGVLDSMKVCGIQMLTLSLLLLF